MRIAFKLVVTPGSRVRIKVHAYELGSALDAVLRVEGNGGASIANADDTTIPLPPKNNVPQSLILPDPTLEMTVPGGTNEITVVIRDLERRGGVGFPYRIVAEPLTPEFELQVNEPQVSIPRGGTAAVGVTVKRKGYTGPIHVTVADPPAGLTVRPGTIAGGQTVGRPVLTAAADARFPAALAQARRPRGGIRARRSNSSRSRPMVFAQQTNLPTSAMTQYRPRRGAGAGDARDARHAPHADRGRAGIRRDDPGQGGSLPGCRRGTGGHRAPAPAGPDGPRRSRSPPRRPRGPSASRPHSRRPSGRRPSRCKPRGRSRNSDQTIAVPAVTLAVVRPASVELAAAAIEVKPGTTAELKGKVVRKGTFNEPVTVRINGLPAGLKADPVTVAGRVPRDFVGESRRRSEGRRRLGRCAGRRWRSRSRRRITRSRPRPSRSRSFRVQKNQTEYASRESVRSLDQGPGRTREKSTMSRTLDRNASTPILSLGLICRPRADTVAATTVKDPAKKKAASTAPAATKSEPQKAPAETGQAQDPYPRRQAHRPPAESPSRLLLPHPA